MPSKPTAARYASPVTGTEGIYDLDEQTNLALYILDHIEAQLNRADTKAQLTLTADAFLVAAMTRTIEGVFISILSAATPFLWRLEALLRVLTMAALVVSVYYAFSAIIPILTRPKSMALNLYYFGSISAMRIPEYVERFVGQDQMQARQSILEEVHQLSIIANIKFTKIRISHLFLIICLIFWLANQVILAALLPG